MSLRVKNPRSVRPAESREPGEKVAADRRRARQDLPPRAQLADYAESALDASSYPGAYRHAFGARRHLDTTIEVR